LPSSYPAGYDAFGNPIPTDALDSVTLPHATNQHADINNAIEAIQGALGLNPQGSDATVAARLSGIEGDVTVVEAQAAGVFDIITGKGDLIVGTANNTVDVLPAGPDGWVVVADSAEPTGLNWILPGDVGNALPPGGTTGQVLIKASDDDFDAAWADISGVVGGGTGSIIAEAPYPTGGVEGAGETDCWLTYTDGSGYQYRVHKFLFTGGVDEFHVTNGVIGQLLVVAGGGSGGWGAGGNGGQGGGGAGGLFYGSYAFGTGQHNLEVGEGGAAGAPAANPGDSGSDSSFDYPGETGVLCYGGGGGQKVNSPNGGSSGGCQSGTPGTATKGIAPDMTLLFGSVGGVGSTNPGGGASGTGRAGKTINLMGADVTYATGGSGIYGPNRAPVDGIDGLGEGGEGCGPGGAGTGGNGVIIIRYRIA
jgi:hypothetical protein